jgi:lipopolysaccharide transport system permease protein
MNSIATVKIIKPRSERSFAEDLADIWNHRELVLVLARRELSVRYRQTVVGLLWVLLQPLVTTAIFPIRAAALIRCSHLPASPFGNTLPVS